MIKGRASKNMFTAYESQLKTFKKSVVKVGLPEKVGSKPHEDSGLSIAQVGMVHEYGVPEKNIPRRSFIREPLINDQKNINKLIKKKFSEVAGNRTTAKTALNQMGIYGQGVSQKSFSSNDWTPLNPKTIKAKGSSKPLIDTGLLQQSITYSVEKRKWFQTWEKL